jgi:Protein of unknown function (DUF3099)
MAREPEPVRITTAHRSHGEDVAARQRRYLISMGVRTVCFVLTVVTIGHWFMWIFLVASLVLPPVAVIIANANAPTDPGGPEWFEPDPATRALESGPATPHEAP